MSAPRTAIADKARLVLDAPPLTEQEERELLQRVRRAAPAAGGQEVHAIQ
jgi:hypothetical protein